MVKNDAGSNDIHFDLQVSILTAIRRIIRAIDLHSKRLLSNYGLSGTQLITLRAIVRNGPSPTGEIAHIVAVTQPTATRIIDRLEVLGLVARERSGVDRRTVIVTATPEGASLAMSAASDLLQDKFRAELEKLPEWEMTSILATLQRIASMMNAEEIDASPLLETAAIDCVQEEGVDVEVRTPLEPSPESVEGKVHDLRKP